MDFAIERIITDLNRTDQPLAPKDVLSVIYVNGLDAESANDAPNPPLVGVEHDEGMTAIVRDGSGPFETFTLTGKRLEVVSA